MVENRSVGDEARTDSLHSTHNIHGGLGVWTLYEITRDSALLYRQEKFLGIAGAVFVLIQWVGLKWLAKSYWIWLPIILVALSVLSPVPYFGGSITVVMVFMVFFAGLLAKDPGRASSRIFRDEIVNSRWYSIIKKAALAIGILIVAWTYFGLFQIIWLIPLSISCTVALMAVKKYQIGFVTAGSALAWAGWMVLYDRSYVRDMLKCSFFAPLNPEMSSKIHGGGLTGTWRLPAESTIHYKFANGEFAFATISQVHGILGITCLLLAVLLFAYLGLRAVVHAKDRFSAALVLSMTLFLTTQMLMSAMGGCGLIGFIGYTFPFFTCGGSNLILGAIGGGLILKQLRLRSDANPLQLQAGGIFLVVAGFSLIIWVKTALCMIFGI